MALEKREIDTLWFWVGDGRNKPHGWGYGPERKSGGMCGYGLSRVDNGRRDSALVNARWSLFLLVF